MVAPRSGINSAPAPAPEEPPLLDVTKQSGNSRRRLNPARWLVQGAFRECISHQEEGHALTHSGTFLVFMEYILFVALSLFGGFTAPVNISICGYMELLPDWVAFLYCHVRRRRRRLHPVARRRQVQDGAQPPPPHPPTRPQPGMRGHPHRLQRLPAVPVGLPPDVRPVVGLRQHGGDADHEPPRPKTPGTHVDAVPTLDAGGLGV